MLLFLVSILVVTLFALANFSNLTAGNVEGVRDAYFTKVRHGATAYEGSNFTWSLTIYNKNCSTDSEGEAYFYFVFYLDDDLWWDEYNNTDYQIWQCNKGDSTTRSYGVSSWHTIKPVAHELRIELYWYDGNASQLEDFSSFPVPVAVHAEPASLMVTSYLFIYLITTFFLAFYIVIAEPIKIFSISPNSTLVSGKKTIQPAGFLSKVRRELFLFFFLLIFVSLQTISAIFYTFSVPEELRLPAYLTAQITYIIVLVLLIRKENSNFREYGFLWPEETRKYMAISLLLAVLYSFVTIFVPGFFAGYDVFPSSFSTEAFSPVLLALVAVIASETIFRGYIQSKLTKLSGFSSALLTTSVMFTLYELPFWPFNLFRFFPEFLSLFALGIFLGILLYRTKTLLCPVIFYFTFSVLKLFTPLRAIASEYSELLVQFLALALSLVILIVIAEKEKPLTSDEENMLFEEN